MDIKRSQLEADCPEALPPRVPSLGLEPHKATLRSRDAHWAPSDATLLDDEDTIDSGFMSGSISSINRDSGLEIVDQLDGMHISEEGFGGSKSFSHSKVGDRDSGFDACCDQPQYTDEMIVDSLKDQTETEDSVGYVSAEAEKLFPSYLNQLFEQDEDGDNHLHIAIIHCKTDAIQQIIELCPSADKLNIQNDLRQTALHLAVLTDQPLIVRKLMAWGAKLEVWDRNGNTPLHLACRNGLESCVEMLTTPLKPRETQVVPYNVPTRSIPQNLSIKNYNGEPCLHSCLQAKAGSRLRIIHYLITRCGANVNTMEGKSGRTLLHEAASADDSQLTEYLLNQLNVLIDSRTYSGYTALKLAKSSGFDGIACKLIGKGADQSDLSDSMSDSDDDSMEST